MDLTSDSKFSNLSDEDHPDFEINHEALQSNTAWTEPDVESEEENEHSNGEPSIEKKTDASLTENISPDVKRTWQ